MLITKKIIDFKSKDTVKTMLYLPKVISKALRDLAISNGCSLNKEIINRISRTLNESCISGRLNGEKNKHRGRLYDDK